MTLTLIRKPFDVSKRRPVDSWAAAEAHMRAAPTGTQCQVTVAALRRVFSLSFAAVD